MPRKVMCGNELMQAAGTVTKKFAKWLVEKGYIEAEESEYAQERAQPRKTFPMLRRFSVCSIQSVRELMTVVKEFRITSTSTVSNPANFGYRPLLASTAVIGPFLVPTKITELCGTGWDMGGVVAKVGKEWQFVEIWNVSP